MPSIRSLALVSTRTGSDQAAGGTDPSVSADGRRVAFERPDDGVAVVTPATGAVRQPDGATAGANPQLSADGDTLVVAADDAGAPAAVVAADLAAGTSARVPGGELGPGLGSLDRVRPAVTADGGTVAFAAGGTVTVADRDAGTADMLDPALPLGRTDGVTLTPDGRILGLEQRLRPGGGSEGPSIPTNTVLADRASGLTERLDGDGVFTETAIRTPTETRAAAVSADGRFAAYVRGDAEVVLEDRASDRVEVIAPTPGGAPDPAVSIDADGRRVAFASTSDDLVPGDDNGVRDVFVFDRVTDEVTRVSETSGGTGGDGASRDPEISADGETVVFESAATNLGGGDNGDPDVFRARLDEPAFPAERAPEPVGDQVRLRADEEIVLDVLANDRDPDGVELEIADASVQRGAVDVTVTPGDRLDIDPDRDAADPATITYTVEDADGRTATGRVAVDIEPDDGVRVTAVRDAGIDAGRIGDVALGEDGELVAFSASASDLVPDDANNADDVFVFDTADGSLRRVSETDDGRAPETGIKAFDLSPDGEALAFASDAANLVDGDTNGVADVFLKDLGSDDLDRVSVGADGREADAPARAPAAADDGSAVAFVSASDELVPGDDNGEADVFVRDTGQGSLTRISEGLGTGNAVAADVAIGADGRFVSFLDGAAPEGEGGVVLHDRETDTSERFGPAVDLGGIRPPSLSLSPDGGTIAVSQGATPTAIDAETGRTTPIAARPDGTEANFNTAAVDLSEDGERAVFTSEAANLVPGDGNIVRDAFVRTFDDPDVDVLDLARPTATANATDAAVAATGEVAAFARQSLQADDARLLIAELADAGTAEAPPANGLPHAEDAALTGVPGASLTTDLGEDVSDPDGDDLAFTIDENPANGTATIADDGTLTYTPGPDAEAGDSFTYAVTDPAGGRDTATVRVEPASPGRNLTVLDGSAQTLSVPFETEVRGTAVGERVIVERGAEVTLAAGNGDGVALPGPLGSYDIGQAGNQLVLARPADDTRATVALNAALEIGFADGVAEAGIEAGESGPAIALGGETVGPEFDPEAARLDPGRPGTPGAPRAADAANLTVLDGTEQRVEVPFPGRVVGTSAAETVAVSGEDGAVRFTAGAGDRVALPGSLANADLDASGNVLAIDSAGADAEIALNAAVEIAFTDGTATARLDRETGDIRLGGQVVRPGFDAADAEADRSDVSHLTAELDTSAIDPITGGA